MRRYYGLGAIKNSIDSVKAITNLDPAIARIVASKTPVPTMARVVGFSQSSSGNGSQSVDQTIMYQCPNGKLIPTPDVSLCEEVATTTTVTNSGFGKYLLPAGIILAAILLLK